MEKQLTGQDLINYISRFREGTRDDVLKQVLADRLLAEFLSSSQGRLIVDHVINSINSNVMKIVQLATSDSRNIKDIEQAALDIKIAKEFMTGIANIAQNGEKHRDMAAQ
jgi:hypothetical protein